MEENFLMNTNTWKHVVVSFINTIGDVAKGTFYRAGLETGREFVKNYKINEKNLDKVSEIFSQMNWGKIKIDLKKLHIVIDNSFEARAIGKSKECSCYFLKGFVAGLLSTILNKDLKAEEVKCKSKGDKYCEFKLSKTAEWYERVSKILEEV